MENNELNKAPQPFCFNKSKVKAFVLGADPTNFSKDSKRVDLYFAFGIGQNPNYFRALLQNLKDIDLHLEDIYIQNLLPDYQDKETGKNENFKHKASENAKLIAGEFNIIDPSKRVPVFATAEDVYKAVLNEDAKKFKAEELYNLETELPVPPNRNKLKRPIIPLFRHDKYRYTNWPEFKEHVMNSLID
ncbi:MAG: hypothetical protein KAX05_09285 [Bacteroidales bacterium]|nr:hypothetical protein [Bacteroidales bacterium]